MKSFILHIFSFVLFWMETETKSGFLRIYFWRSNTMRGIRKVHATNAIDLLLREHI